MKKLSVICIGAGPAGLAAAYELTKAGHQVRVLEASPYVGGLGRSFELWGQTVDLGPHRFFSADRVVNDLWHEVIGQDYSMVNRLTRIYYQGKFYFYPLQPFNAFFNLGPIDVVRCIGSYAKAKLSSSRPARTLEEWVTGRFGRRLYEVFFKTYTEKVWGIPCSRIDADWASQRIKKLSLFEAIKSAFIKDKSKKHKTLLDQFAYPKGGTGTLYQGMVRAIQNRGGTVEMQSPVSAVLLHDDNGEMRAAGVTLADGTNHFADLVISSMPLTHMVQRLKGVPHEVLDACNKLSYRNTILVYLEMDSNNLFPDNWVYIHSPEVLHGRITNFRNWCPSLNGDKKTTILCMEFWCFDHDSIWQNTDSELGALAIRELAITNLVNPSVGCLRTHIERISRSYPVYEAGYLKPLKVIQDYLDSIQGLFAIGRYGAFKYNNQDHSILMGILAAREINTGVAQNLWNINTDTDYQEDASVHQTGLTES